MSVPETSQNYAYGLGPCLRKHLLSNGVVGSVTSDLSQLCYHTRLVKTFQWKFLFVVSHDSKCFPITLAYLFWPHSSSLDNSCPKVTVYGISTSTIVSVYLH